MLPDCPLLGQNAIPHTGIEGPKREQGRIQSRGRVFDLDLTESSREFAQGAWNVKGHEKLTSFSAVAACSLSEAWMATTSSAAAVVLLKPDR